MDIYAGKGCALPSFRFGTMEKIFRILRIRRGEVLVTGLLCLYVAGVMCFYYILKPLRSALFLKDLPASDLPYAYLLAALIASPIVMLMSKLNRSLSVIGLMTATNMGVIGSLLFFRWAVSAQFRYLPYIYFSYVQIVAVLCIAQFWLLAGYIFDGRQAKRLYRLLGAGAIAGSIAGSMATDLLKRTSIGFMLGICVGICIALAVLAHVIWRKRGQDVGVIKKSYPGSGSRDGTLGMLRTVFGSRHLRLMVLLVFLTMIASQIVDWQVDYAAQESFKHLPKESMEQEIKSFRARFNWVTNLIGIGLQMGLTHFVLQRFGIGAALLFLPFGLGIASLGVLFVPSLRSAALALGCNSVFRFSINRAGVELLFLPLSPNVRRRIKLFIDVSVDRAGRAVAAFIILAFTIWYRPAGLTGAAAVVIVLSGACILVSLRLRRSYADAFRQHLVRREVDLSEISRYVTDPASMRLLISVLESPHERQILYSLGLLQSSRGYDFSAQLLPLLQHLSPLVREEAVRTLHVLPGNHESAAERLLEDVSDGVRDAAVEYLSLHDPARTEERFHQLLEHPNPDIRLAAARCAAGQPDPLSHTTMDLIRNIVALDGTGAVKAHQVAALLAVKLPAGEYIPFLRGLIRDPRPQVAAASISAAGNARCLELASDILPRLSDRDLRSASRQALASIGPPAIDDLAAVLDDEKQDFAVRCEIPWILSRIEDAQSAAILVQNLGAEDFRLKYQIVKALSRMHARNPHLPANTLLVEVHVIAQIMAYYEGLAMLLVFEERKKSKTNGMIGRALRERLDRQLEIIFRLLGICYPQKDIYFAYTALKNGDRLKRTSAIEFLDNTLKKDVRTLVLPMLEEETMEQLLARGKQSFHVPVPARNDALIALLRQPDPWLKSCALHEAGCARIARLEPFYRELLRDPDSRVREMAGWALSKMAPNTEEDAIYAD